MAVAEPQADPSTQNPDTPSMPNTDASAILPPDQVRGDERASSISGAIEKAKAEKPSKKERARSIIVLALRALRRQSSSKQEIVPAGPSVISPSLAAGGTPPSRRPGFVRRHALFLGIVVLPTLFASLYYTFYANDIYVSESTFVVRGPNKQHSPGGLGALLGAAGAHGGGIGAVGEMATVAEYISSRDALTKLKGHIDVASSWGSDEVDLLSRFDPLKWDNSFEALFRYYPRRVQTISDALAGITALSVSSFNAQEALVINRFLLSEAERLVNNLNSRAREDLIRFAANEVAAAEEASKAAAMAVSDFRNKEAVVDPEAQTQLHFEQIARLQEELIKTKAQLTQLRVFAPDSPHPPALELRARTLESEIASETEKISGGDNSLASKAAEFQRLNLERQFASQQLAAALASLETARNEAQRQQLYLETIAKPSLPDKSTEPKRLKIVVTTFALSFILWGIVSMLVAGIREHTS